MSVLGGIMCQDSQEEVCTDILHIQNFVLCHHVSHVRTVIQ